MSNENKDHPLVNNEFNKLSQLRKIRHVAFLSDLENLSRKTGVCYASNEYFQLGSKNVLTGSSIDTIQRFISMLRDAEFISVTRKTGNRREIRLTLRGLNVLREYGFLNFADKKSQDNNSNDILNDSTDTHNAYSMPKIKHVNTRNAAVNTQGAHSKESKQTIDQNQNTQGAGVDTRHAAVNTQGAVVDTRHAYSIDYNNYNNYSVLQETENKEKVETNNIDIQLQKKEFAEKEKLVVTKESEITVNLEGRRGPTSEQYAKKINTLNQNSLTNLTDVFNYLVAL